MATVNYTPNPTPQALGGAMMPLDVQNAAPPSGAPAMGGVPQMSPQDMQKMMQMNGYAPGYMDNSGVSGQTLAANGIAPGGTGGLMGLLQQGSGNPLGLSSGTSFSPQDLQALQGAFNG